MARPHSSRSRGSKLAAATSAGDKDGDMITGEDEHAAARRYPTRGSTAVTSKTNATTKKPTTKTTRKSAAGNLTTPLKPTTSKATTRSQKAAIDAGLGSQTRANGKMGMGTPAKVNRRTGTKVKMEAKIKAPREKRKSAAAAEGKGEKQIKMSDQKWESLKGFGSFIGEYERRCLGRC